MRPPDAFNSLNRVAVLARSEDGQHDRLGSTKSNGRGDAVRCLKLILEDCNSQALKTLSSCLRKRWVWKVEELCLSGDIPRDGLEEFLDEEVLPDMKIISLAAKSRTEGNVRYYANALCFIMCGIQE
jgi:hypothetical protein